MVSYIPIWFIKVWTEKRRTRRAMATNFAEVLMITFWFTVSITAIDSYNVTATWLYHSVTITATWLFHGDYDHSFLSLPQCPWPQLPYSTTVPSPQLPDSSTVNMTTATWLFHSEYDHCYLTLPECPLPQLPYSSTVPITTATWLCQCRRISEACWAVQSLWGRCVRSWSHEIINIIEKLTKLTKNYKIKTKQKNQNINST